MWFKQARIFELSKSIPYDAEWLEACLQPLVYTPCLPSFSASHGWAPVIENEHGSLVHASNGYLLFCLQVEEKILPSTVIQQSVNEKIRSMEKKQGRKVSRKEKLDLKDEMTQTLLPRAFSKFSPVYAYIDTRKNQLVVNHHNAKRIEAFEKLFSRCCDEIKLRNIQTKKIAYLLTQWLVNGGIPESFSIGEGCLLRDPDQQTRRIRCQNQDLFSNGLQSILKDNHEVVEITLHWQDRVIFNLTEDFHIKNIRYSDSLVDTAKNHPSENEEQRFDTNFYLMSETLSDLWNDLLSYFGKPHEEKTSYTIVETIE